MVVPGLAMASGDTCIITVKGCGGPGAMPQLALDHAVAGASIVMALQTGIISVGAFLSGDAPNVIPCTAELRLTVRAMRPDVRYLLEQRITEIAQTQAASYGAVAEPEPITASEGFAFNDRVLSTGASYCVKLVERWLAAG